MSERPGLDVVSQVEGRTASRSSFIGLSVLVSDEYLAAVRARGEGFWSSVEETGEHEAERKRMWESFKLWH